MRRITLALLVVFAFISNNAHAQLEVIFTGNPTVQPGGQVSVDVSVNNFNNLFGVQFSMNWDSLVLEYASVTNIVPNSILPDVSMASIGNPSALGVEPGQATFSWFPFDGSGKTVPDGTVLFTLVFDGVGAACSSTSIVLSNEPRVIEVSLDDGNNTNIGAVSSGISLEIDCGGGMMDCGPNLGNPSCGTGNPGGLGIIGSDELVPSGTNVCMEVTVENFSDIQSMEMNVIWDASLLNYSNSQNYNTNVAGLGASNFFFIGDNMGSDTLRMVWFDFNANMPATLTDGDLLLEICFDAVGPNGSYADVMFLDSEFGDSGQNQVDHYTDCGSVEICVDDPPDAEINLYAQDSTYMDASNICVPVYADGFTDVQSFQFTMDWLDGVLAFGSIQNINPALVPPPLFNTTDQGILPLNWFTSDSDGVTLADGSILFEVCFDFIGDCNNPATNNSDITFINQPNFAIEFGDINDELITPVITSDANIVIGCDSCDVSITTNQPGCIGQTGSILLTGGAMPYMGCEWTLNNNPFNPGGCNVFAGLPGNYAVTVTDANGEICELSTTLVNPLPIQFTPVVTDVSCIGDGAVVVPTANISGGSGVYDPPVYSPAGPYTDATSVMITVTDSNGCTQTQTVSVGNTITDLVVESTSFDGSCSNQDGTITVELSGGCAPYSATGGVANGNTITFSGLVPDEYTETISDDAGNTVMVGPITIPFFDAVTASPVVTDASMGGTDGMIDLNLMGGAMPYTTVITPNEGTQTGPNGDIFMDLPPGNYSFTISDDNGCMLNIPLVTVGEEDPDDTLDIVIDLMIISEAQFSGFGVSCNGSCDGAITTSITNTNGPVTSIEITDGTTIFTDPNATDLCPGTYTMTVVDSLGIMEQLEFTITEPEQLVVDMFSITCDSIPMNTGAIDMTVSGGVPEYTFIWSSGQDTEDISGVAAGNYTLMVIDGNDCEDIENDMFVPTCDPTEKGTCYSSANNIMTPGASAGANDFLCISCAGNNPNTLNVYDRWGRLVHNSVNYTNDWGGVDMEGNDLGEGTYFWVMDVTFPTGETRLFKGYVTLLRDL